MPTDTFLRRVFANETVTLPFVAYDQNADGAVRNVTGATGACVARNVVTGAAVNAGSVAVSGADGLLTPTFAAGALATGTWLVDLSMTLGGAVELLARWRLEVAPGG